MQDISHLISKYNIPGPRYTSYPTVPYWDDSSFSKQEWVSSIKRSFEESNEKEGISLYIHLPFCESLCTFCACHKRITKRHDVELPYINALLKEWHLYLALFSTKPRIKELHLGGGTPTFFSAENLRFLLNGIFESAQICDNPEFSFEGHPNNTTKEHLETLYELGFRRVSFGVQDYDLKVQKAINRLQPFENVEKVTNWAREIGYESISHDLVYGLPFQNWESMRNTIEKTKYLKPDRIAFYSYAHVPWVKGVGQRGFDENDLPKPEEKRRLYEEGKLLLNELGYVEIGMDHFSLPEDALHKSYQDNKLHRNFMGYSSSSTQLMIGLGMSAISDSWYAFAQNEKTVEAYYAMLDNKELPLLRGHVLTENDLIIRRMILDLMCQFKVTWPLDGSFQIYKSQIISRLIEMSNDGLLKIDENGLTVTALGRLFVRNIAMAFDIRLWENEPTTRIFSMTI